jgi:hypothetical protein
VSEQLKPIIEALIFASPEPITRKVLYKLLDGEENILPELLAVLDGKHADRVVKPSSAAPLMYLPTDAPLDAAEDEPDDDE